MIMLTGILMLVVAVGAILVTYYVTRRHDSANFFLTIIATLFGVIVTLFALGLISEERDFQREMIRMKTKESP